MIIFDYVYFIIKIVVLNTQLNLSTTDTKGKIILYNLLINCTLNYFNEQISTTTRASSPRTV